MSSFRRASLLVLTLCASIAAQQSGTPQRNYTINGVGSLSPSYVTQTIGVPAVSLQNVYATQDPNAPVAWAISTSAVTGWYTTATNSVDIGPNGLSFLGDGTGIFAPSPLSPFMRTGGTGTFALTLNTNSALAGLSAYLAMLHLSGTSPDGFYISQTHLLTLALDPNITLGTVSCSPTATPLTLSDDSAILQALGFNFPFFGTSYTSIFVGSNGNCTFNTQDVGFTESVATFLSGPPRIAEYWDDFNPTLGGTVSFFTDNASLFQVCFTGVSEFGALNSNTFEVTALASPAGVGVSMTYDTAMASNDGLVGLSPGTSIATGLSLNLSVGPNAIGAGQAPYQLFVAPATPNDLKGYTIIFQCDPAGVPVSQF